MGEGRNDHETIHQDVSEAATPCSIDECQTGQFYYCSEK